MKTTISILDNKYRGLAYGSEHNYPVTPCTVITTKGLLWWKVIIHKDMYAVMGTRDVISNTGSSVEVDPYWAVIRTFDNREEAVVWRDVNFS